MVYKLLRENNSGVNALDTDLYWISFFLRVSQIKPKTRNVFVK